MTQSKERVEAGLGFCADSYELNCQTYCSPGSSPSRLRTGSAPPTFDSSSLFLYMENDIYTRSFSKEPSYNLYNDPTETSQIDSKLPEEFHLKNFMSLSKNEVLVKFMLDGQFEQAFCTLKCRG